MKVFSFDVFDTAVVRCLAHPTDLFDYVPAKAGIDCADFKTRRVAAEHDCYARHGGHATLEMIYRDECRLIGLTAEELSRFRAAEVELELFACRAVPVIAQRIEEARTQGARIAFLSDMYLPSDVIRKILSEGNLYREGDLLLVSGEERAGKWDGALFRILFERLGVSAREVHHTGNNYRSDYEAPRKLGMRATYFEDGNLTAREEKLAAYDKSPRSWCSLIAGAARRTRLEERQTPTSHLAAVKQVAAEIGGPVLAMYVLWILKTAQADGIRALYFVARDGYQMVLMARSLAEGLGIDMEIRYLYGSRQAWYLPGVEELDEDVFLWLLRSTPELTLERLLARAELTPEDVAEELKRQGVADELFCRELTGEDLEYLKKVFLKSESIRQQILQRADRNRESLLAYLEGEGFGRDLPCAVVDLGWMGRCVHYLNRVLKKRQWRPAGAYFMNIISRDAMNRDFKGYVPTENRMDMMEIMLLESMFTAPHGSTTGYRFVDGRSEPILDEPSAFLKEWGVPTVCATTERFGQLLLEASAFWSAQNEIPWTTLTDYLSDIMANMSRGEMRAWGVYQFDTEQVKGVGRPLAQPLPVNLHTVWTALVVGNVPKSYRAYWIECCYSLTPRWFELLIRYSIRLRVALAQKVFARIRRLIGR
jgi:predicted HAD superfamily hydrolase